MLLSVEGPEGSGKTTLAYSAPLPIVGFQFDLGDERAINGARWDLLFKGLNIVTVEGVERDTSGADIVIHRLPRRIQIGDTFVGIKEQWESILALIAAVATDDSVNSVVIDTGTLARKLAIDAHMQAKQRTDPGRKQLLQIEYGVPNQEIANIYSAFKAIGKNLVVTHHLTDEYAPQVGSSGRVESMPTGKLVAEGYNKTPQMMDVIVRTSTSGGSVQASYVKCGYNLGLKDAPTPNDPTWDTIVTQIGDSLGGRIILPTRRNEA